MMLFQQIKSALASLAGSVSGMPCIRSESTSAFDLEMNGWTKRAGQTSPGCPRHAWADDKTLVKARLREHDLPVPPTHAVASSVEDIGAAWETVRSLDRFVVKPTRGRGGRGILALQRALDRGDEYWRTPSGRRMTPTQIQRYMADLVSEGAVSGSVIMEYQVMADAAFHQIYPRSLSALRVVMHDGTPVGAIARIPTDASDRGVNLDLGVLEADINLRSGVMAAAYDGDGYLAEHPDTYASIEGVKIKNWDTILDICTRTADVVPLTDFGVDLVIDADKGPMIMEIDVPPGLDIENVTQQGLRRILDDV